MGGPTLHLTVGLPGTGKTTAARRLEAERRVLRLTKDEWVKALHGEQTPERAQDVIEGRLVEIGLRALELGSTSSSTSGCGAGTSGRPSARQRQTVVRSWSCTTASSTRQSSGAGWSGARPRRPTPPG